MKPTLAPFVPEILRVPPEADSVCCDGGGVLGHPAVYYRFGADGRAECLYCDRVFIK